MLEHGYEVVEVEFEGPAHGAVLRLYVDCERGITLDDCQAVTHLIGPLLDEEDMVPGPYTLEVSSPGLDRPLRKAADFERFAGEAIRIKAQTPVEGQRNFRGVLKGLRDGQVIVECDGAERLIHTGNVRKANLDR